MPVTSASRVAVALASSNGWSGKNLQQGAHDGEGGTRQQEFGPDRSWLRVFSLQHQVD